MKFYRNNIIIETIPNLTPNFKLKKLITILSIELVLCAHIKTDGFIKVLSRGYLFCSELFIKLPSPIETFFLTTLLNLSNKWLIYSIFLSSCCSTKM